MKTSRIITRKSLDELARTMNVIPEDERDMYWGMYDNDCFWRCVAYIKTGGASYDESAAASLAYEFWTSEYGYQGINHLSATNDSGISDADMTKYINGNSMVVANSADNRIIELIWRLLKSSS